MSPPAPPMKHFSLSDANRALPLVRAIVEDIVELYSDIEERRVRIAGLRRSRTRTRSEDDPYEAEVRDMEQDLDGDIDRFRLLLDELSNLGVELKDAQAGLVDFRTLMDGREACLSWQLGEPEVAHWHELDEETPERRRLEKDVPDVDSLPTEDLN